MWCEYDENLNENEFLKEIIKNHGDILKRASEESWIICVPRRESFEFNQLTINNIFDHILIPNNEIKNVTYTTLSKKPIKINNKQIELVGNHEKLNSIQVLFEETFYIEKSLKYVVWCLENPLFINYTFCSLNQSKNLETFQDCIDFLWTKNDNNIFEQIQKECTKFLKNHTFESDHLQTQKELIGNLYSRCLQIALKTNDLNKQIIDENLIENFKLSVETYMQFCLNTKLIEAINSFVYVNDSYLNKIIRNSNNLHLNDLNISNNLCDIITNAKCELNKLNNYVTIIDKIYCLKSTFTQLCNNNNNNNNYCLNSDDFLQIFVFLILRLNINNWIGNLIYLQQFRFSTLNLNDQNQFLLTTLEAAIEFIKSNQFLDIKSNLKIPNDEDELFTLIRLNNLNELKQLINEKKLVNRKPLNEFQSYHHHPLCDCRNCLKNLQSQNNSKLINDKGQSLLIFACLLGRREIVELILNSQQLLFDLNYFDYFGRTALHYACMNGYQDILLILLNSSNIDINAKDNDGNQCLHLAVNYGHENCVKALLYSVKYISINSVNKSGETALHLAVRWNFIEIIKILLENHSLTNIYNKRNQLPIHLSNNYYVRNLLKDCTIDEHLINKLINKFVIIESESNQNITNNNRNCKEHGIRPKTIEHFKKIDLLLKAIENNDLPLTYYYLGFKNVENSIVTNQTGKCHPLCNCDNCTDFDSLTTNQQSTPIIQPFNINTCNSDGFTPLHIAAKYGRNEILRLLLDSQASPNLKTYKTLQTPLHLACIYQRIQIVRELVQCGDCQIDCYDSKGNTPLFYACIKNDSRIVEILLNNGADCNVRNHKGQTVFGEVQEKMFYGILKLLKDHSRVDLDTEDFLF